MNLFSPWCSFFLFPCFVMCEQRCGSVHVCCSATQFHLVWTSDCCHGDNPLPSLPPGHHVTLSLPRCLACVWRTSLIRLHSRALCAPACEKPGPSSPHRWNFNFTPRSQSLPAMSCCCHSEELIFIKRQAGKGRG